MMLNVSYVIWLVLFEQEIEFKQMILIFFIFIGINLVLFSKRNK